MKTKFNLTLLFAFFFSGVLFAGGPNELDTFKATDCSHAPLKEWQIAIEQAPEVPPVLKSQGSNPFETIKEIVDVVRSGEWQDILGLESIIIGLLTLIIGWFSDKIPFFEKIGNTEIRIFAIAAVIILAFAVGGLQSAVINGVIGYLMANRSYALIIKYIFDLFKKEPSKPNTNVA